MIIETYPVPAAAMLEVETPGIAIERENKTWMIRQPHLADPAVPGSGYAVVSSGAVIYVPMVPYLLSPGADAHVMFTSQLIGASIANAMKATPSNMRMAALRLYVSSPAIVTEAEEHPYRVFLGVVYLLERI